MIVKSYKNYAAIVTRNFNLFSLNVNSVPIGKM
jgi:hypothetical protein